jgi:hypothetical protein
VRRAPTGAEEPAAASYRTASFGPPPTGTGLHGQPNNGEVTTTTPSEEVPPPDEPLLEETIEVEQEPSRKSFVKKSLAGEARARTVGRQPPERVRFGHDVSSLAGDARSGREFGLLEGSHWKDEIRHDTSSMAGRGATASACACVGGAHVLLDGDECHISRPHRCGSRSRPIWTLVTPEQRLGTEMTHFLSSWTGMTKTHKFKDRWCILHYI